MMPKCNTFRRDRYRAASLIQLVHFCLQLFPVCNIADLQTADCGFTTRILVRALAHLEGRYSMILQAQFIHFICNFFQFQSATFPVCRIADLQTADLFLKKTFKNNELQIFQSAVRSLQNRGCRLEKIYLNQCVRSSLQSADLPYINIRVLHTVCTRILISGANSEVVRQASYQKGKK